MGPHAASSPALVANGALLRPVEAVDDIQHGTLAGAVGADNRQNLTRQISKLTPSRARMPPKDRRMSSTLSSTIADPSRRRAHALRR